VSAPLGFARRIRRAVTAGATGAMFGLYAAVVAGVLALASTGSPVAMVIAGLLLAAFVAALVYWSGAPTAPPPGQDKRSERLS
jgi:membrane protein implicated in regulation of membrane protease activity